MNLTGDKMLSVKEVLDLLGVSRTTLYNLTKKGEIPSYQIGGSVKYKQSEIDDYIKRSKRHKQ